MGKTRKIEPESPFFQNCWSASDKIQPLLKTVIFARIDKDIKNVEEKSTKRNRSKES